MLLCYSLLKVSEKVVKHGSDVQSYTSMPRRYCDLLESDDVLPSPAWKRLCYRQLLPLKPRASAAAPVEKAWNNGRPTWHWSKICLVLECRYQTPTHNGICSTDVGTCWQPRLLIYLASIPASHIEVLIYHLSPCMLIGCLFRTSFSVQLSKLVIGHHLRIYCAFCIPSRHTFGPITLQ